ncbi:ABC transporter ATP-binding protein [bacterium F11]|nr:ABC transporter ATP-binding protein [bacterium F11]
MIQIRSLKFQYPHSNFRLNIPEFQIEKSKKVAVIGPSGSGKTTLLNLMAGILSPDEGTIQVDSHYVDTLNDDQRRAFRIQNIGFVFQDFELIDYLNVLDNILHPFRITPALILNKSVVDQALSMANRMGIGDQLENFPGHLSQGEKQRTAICRALLPHPKLILADEATGNLDPENKIQILDLLFKSVEEHDATLLAVTHDHELLSRFDRVVDFKSFRQRGPS